MEKKKANKKAELDSALKKEEQKPSQLITVDTFVTECVRKGKLRAEQKAEVAAFFRDMKLREKEDSETFEATLAKY